MELDAARRLVRRAGAGAMLWFPALFMVVFVMHHRSLQQFFTFRLRFTPPDAERMVSRLIEIGRARAVVHDPHVLGYLSMPVFLACVLSVARLLWTRTPGIALVGGTLGAIGSIYLGSLFGTWSAFFAIGNVPPEHLAGATAAWKALTEMQGVLALTTLLSRLAIVSLVVLAAGLWRSRVVARWSPLLIAAGSLLILAFADLDNWMFLGSSLIFIGMIPVRRAILNS